MTTEFKTEIIGQLNENLPRIKTCLEKLSEDDVWFSPNEQTNAIGNLILHVSGNIRQYGISGISNLPDNRDRPTEFSSTQTHTKQELFAIISSTISECCATISSLSERELLTQYQIQGFELNGISVLVHIAEHLSYHVGQIALLTKLIAKQDLGFYADFDLNAQ